jgi:hypothetical protein
LLEYGHCFFDGHLLVPLWFRQWDGSADADAAIFLSVESHLSLQSRRDLHCTEGVPGRDAGALRPAGVRRHALLFSVKSRSVTSVANRFGNRLDFSSASKALFSNGMSACITTA